MSGLTVIAALNVRRILLGVYSCNVELRKGYTGTSQFCLLLDYLLWYLSCYQQTFTSQTFCPTVNVFSNH